MNPALEKLEKEIARLHAVSPVAGIAKGYAKKAAPVLESLKACVEALEKCRNKCKQCNGRGSYHTCYTNYHDLGPASCESCGHIDDALTLVNRAMGVGHE